MPSLWKKHKGNRISRLVADFQTPPKRGGSLVVETGFPTSIVDLFVKNRDRLKKPSKKKHRSKEPTTTTTTTTESEDPFHVLPSPVSNPHVSLSKLDVPSCSIDEKNQEIVAQEINSDLYDEEIVAQKNPNVELNRDFVNDECEKNEVGSNWGLLNSKKAIWFSILTGALVVVVALYTKKVVVGITLGALFMLLFEYVGNLVFGFLKPCEDAKGNLQGFSRVSKGGIGIGSKVAKQGERGVLFKSSSKKEVGNNVNSDREIGNGMAPMGFIEQDGSSITSKGEINQGNGVASLVKESSCLDEEVESKTVCEIEVLEPNACVWKNNSNGDGHSEYCEPRSKKGTIVGGGGEKEGECSKMVNHNGKIKKGKKFWKKLVPKHIHRKRKHKQKKEEEHQNHEVPIEEITDEFDEEDDQEEEDQLMVDGEESSLSSTYNEVECGGTEPPLGSVNHSHSGMLQNGAIKKRVLNVKGFGIVVIVLAGLIQGRILALALTVICCLVFKMMRS